MNGGNGPILPSLVNPQSITAEPAAGDESGINRATAPPTNVSTPSRYWTSI